jgi:hypothetical protein
MATTTVATSRAVDRAVFAFNLKEAQKRNIAQLLKAKFPKHVPDPGMYGVADVQAALWRKAMGNREPGAVDVTLQHNGATIHVNDAHGARTAREYLKATR